MLHDVLSTITGVSLLMNGNSVVFVTELSSIAADAVALLSTTAAVKLNPRSCIVTITPTPFAPPARSIDNRPPIDDDEIHAVA